MRSGLSAALIAESQSVNPNVWDLLKVEFPSQVGTLYWGNEAHTYGGHSYVARLNSVGEYTRSMNQEQENLTVVINNQDGYVTDIRSTLRACNPPLDFEVARVSLIRFYPDVGVAGEAIDPYWVGYGGQLELDEEYGQWTIGVGFRSFTQKALRKFSATCWKIFKDGLYCPYNGTSIGASSTLSADPGTGESISVADGSYYRASQVIKLEDELVLLSGVAGNTLSAVGGRGYNDTTIVAHAIGTRAYHHSCNKSRVDCDRMRMYGVLSGGDGKRYFGGWNEFPPVTFQGSGHKHPWWGFVLTGLGGMLISQKKTAYTQSTSLNRGVTGSLIPVVYGKYRLNGVAPAAFTDAKEYKHAFYHLCEGTIDSISMYDAEMGGLPIDDLDLNKLTSAATQEPFMVWWGSTGQRQSRAVVAGQDVDTYTDNPYLFTAAVGSADGPSFSDIACARARIQEGGNEFDANAPSLDVSLVGRLIKPIANYPGGTNSVAYPDVIEAVADFLTNGKFGAREDEGILSLAEFTTMSAYCRAAVTIQANLQSFVGGILLGPTDLSNSVAKKDWAEIQLDVPVHDGELVGRTINITTVGKEQTRIIISNEAMSQIDNPESLSSAQIAMGYSVQTTGVDDTYQRIVVDEDWDTGTEPASGDAFEVTGYNRYDTNPRFMFNGVLLDDTSVEQMLGWILDNCNGYYFIRGEKIVPGIRKAETVNPALPVLTDTGASRNILRDPNTGKSSLRIVDYTASDGVINQVEVTYPSAELGYQEQMMYIYDEDLQTRLGTLLTSTSTRIINTKSLKLIGTTSRDQAMRLGTLKLREENMKRTKITFDMFLKDSQLLEPGDVRTLTSLSVGGDANRKLYNGPIRIYEIKETGKFVASITAYPHDNTIYNDGVDGVVDTPLYRNSGNSANWPEPVTPTTPVETIEYSKDGTTTSTVLLEVTYPS